MNIRPLNYAQCCKMVDRISNLEQAKIARAWLLKADITNEQFDELMEATAYLTRELYRIPNHSFI